MKIFPAAPANVLGLGDQQRLRACIENPLDQRRVIFGGANCRVGRIGSDCLQLFQHRQRIARRMLSIEQQPIEAASRQSLRGEARGQCAPKPDLLSPSGDGVLEGIAGRSMQRLSRDPGKLA